MDASKNIPPVQAQEEPEPYVLPEPLERIPFPPYVRILAVVTALVFIVSLIRVPHSIDMGVKYERAMRSISSGDPNTAVRYLEPIATQYSNSESLKLDLAEAYAYADMFPEAVRELTYFEGRSVTRDQEERLTKIESYLVSKLPKESGE